jgi:hypothetical protein
MTSGHFLKQEAQATRIVEPLTHTLLSSVPSPQLYAACWVTTLASVARIEQNGLLSNQVTKQPNVQFRPRYTVHHPSLLQAFGAILPEFALPLDDEYNGEYPGNPESYD